MRFDTTLVVYAVQRVETDMGGFEETVTPVSSIQAFLSPVTLTKQLREYGLSQSKTFKLITRHPLPEHYSHLGKDDAIYDVIETNDYGRERVLLVEVRP